VPRVLLGARHILHVSGLRVKLLLSQVPLVFFGFGLPGVLQSTAKLRVNSKRWPEWILSILYDN